MPIYEYRCDKCGDEIEVRQHIDEKPLKTCSTCGGEVKRIISASSFVLKGKGWYKTDYAGGSGKNKSTETSDNKTQSPKTPECSACPSSSVCNEM